MRLRPYHLPARRLEGAFTLVEILVSIAILAILFGLMFRPLLMAIEVLSIGESEQRAQAQSRALIDRLTEDLQAALYVYPNTATYDVTSGDTLWRTPQIERLDLVLPARQNGRLLTPVRPATDASGNPQVVTYWLMRDQVKAEDGTTDVPYDPDFNPRRVYRAIHSYIVPAPTPGAVRPAQSPYDLWRYSLDVSEATGDTFADLGTTLQPLFAPGGSFDWYVRDIDRMTPPPSGGAPIMRGPQLGLGISNASRMAGLSTLTDTATDVRELTFLPLRSDLEELSVNTNHTAYRGRMARWLQPYQRSAGGQWTLPSNGQIQDGSRYLPLVAMFRPQGSRDGDGPLGEEYFVTIEQDDTYGRLGHPMVYRLQRDSGSQPVPVYDIAEYPKRIFRNPPGEDPADSALSGEYAAGINWETGEITTVFEQTDVIVPDPGLGVHRIHALNDYNLLSGPGDPPIGQAGDGSSSAEWQSLALTSRLADGTPITGVNGAMLDDYVLTVAGSAAGYWRSYVLSVFRPERLRTGTDHFSGLDLDERQLNMSIVPGSVRVVVEQYLVDSVPDLDPTATPLRRQVYTPINTSRPGALSAGDLARFRFHLDPDSGRLTFYDPSLDADAAPEYDGLNPPMPVPTGGGQMLVPVIYVTYEYRNNLPTVEDIAYGNDAHREVVEATYRSLEQIQLDLVLDVPTTSTSGGNDSLAEPSNRSADFAGTPPDPRPTGARRRVAVSMTLPVGGRR